MEVGYARVSFAEQKFDSQVKALEDAGCTRIFTEQVSSSRHERPQLRACLNSLRPGDTLVVYRFDCLGRSLNELVRLINHLEHRGIDFESISEGIDTRAGYGTLFFHIFSSLGKMESNLTVERTQRGLKAARERGRQGGRRRALSDEQVKQARAEFDQGTTISELATKQDVSYNTMKAAIRGTGVYKHIK